VRAPKSFASRPRRLGPSLGRSNLCRYLHATWRMALAYRPINETGRRAWFLEPALSRPSLMSRERGLDTGRCGSSTPSLSATSTDDQALVILGEEILIEVLIPEEAAPQFLDDAAPRNGMMPPPDSEMIAPPITE
jgi:hypothetical protein